MWHCLHGLNVANPQFTLTCISTGGPATTVTWTRDSVTVTGETDNVLDDPMTAQYTHTVTVTGRLGGLYTRTLANEVTASGASDTLTVEGISTVIAKPNMCIYLWHDLSLMIPHHPVISRQKHRIISCTSILLTWTPSSGVNGYIISYDNGEGSSTTVTGY